MTHLGIGVMLNMLSSDDSGNVFQAVIGKTITALALDCSNDTEDALRIAFSDGSKIALYDNGQSCCERRYMQTDDDLAYHIGATLVSGEVRDAPDVTENNEDAAHEVQFLLITTSRGVFTMSSHNEHNGYYGGFALRVVVDEGNWPAMIYLWHTDGRIEAAECEASAIRLEQRGYTRCSVDLYRMLWQQQHNRALRTMIAVARRHQISEWRIGKVMALASKVRGWEQ